MRKCKKEDFYIYQRNINSIEQVKAEGFSKSPTTAIHQKMAKINVDSYDSFAKSELEAKLGELAQKTNWFGMMNVRYVTFPSFFYIEDHDEGRKK